MDKRDDKSNVGYQGLGRISLERMFRGAHFPLQDLSWSYDCTFVVAIDNDNKIWHYDHFSDTDTIGELQVEHKDDFKPPYSIQVEENSCCIVSRKTGFLKFFELENKDANPNVSWKGNYLSENASADSDYIILHYVPVTTNHHDKRNVFVGVVRGDSTEIYKLEIDINNASDNGNQIKPSLICKVDLKELDVGFSPGSPCAEPRSMTLVDRVNGGPARVYHLNPQTTRDYNIDLGSSDSKKVSGITVHSSVCELLGAWSDPEQGTLKLVDRYGVEVIEIRIPTEQLMTNSLKPTGSTVVNVRTLGNNIIELISVVYRHKDGGFCAVVNYPDSSSSTETIDTTMFQARNKSTISGHRPGKYFLMTDMQTIICTKDVPQAFDAYQYREITDLLPPISVDSNLKNSSIALDSKSANTIMHFLEKTSYAASVSPPGNQLEGKIPISVFCAGLDLIKVTFRQLIKHINEKLKSKYLIDETKKWFNEENQESTLGDNLTKTDSKNDDAAWDDVEDFLLENEEGQETRNKKNLPPSENTEIISSEISVFDTPDLQDVFDTTDDELTLQDVLQLRDYIADKIWRLKTALESRNKFVKLQNSLSIVPNDVSTYVFSELDPVFELVADHLARHALWKTGWEKYDQKKTKLEAYRSFMINSITKKTSDEDMDNQECLLPFASEESLYRGLQTCGVCVEYLQCFWMHSLDGKIGCPNHTKFDYDIPIQQDTLNSQIAVFYMIAAFVRFANHEDINLTNENIIKRIWDKKADKVVQATLMQLIRLQLIYLDPREFVTLVVKGVGALVDFVFPKTTIPLKNAKWMVVHLILTWANHAYNTSNDVILKNPESSNIFEEKSDENRVTLTFKDINDLYTYLGLPEMMENDSIVKLNRDLIKQKLNKAVVNDGLIPQLDKIKIG